MKPFNTVHLRKTYKDASSGAKRYYCKHCMVDLSPWSNLKYTRIGFLSTCVGDGTHMNHEHCNKQDEINNTISIKSLFLRLWA